MWTRPSGAAIVSPFGMRWGRMHEGVDFGAPYGAPIVAIGDGVVVASGLLGEESGYGLITIVEHADGLYSAYAHQSATTVSPGQRVHAGQVIGYVGSSGHSFGPHLHFEIRTTLHGGQINPVGWFHKHHVWV
jgi:murein DD-endopeptidase MepM/ murein hydrolase activator NlpD